MNSPLGSRNTLRQCWVARLVLALGGLSLAATLVPTVATAGEITPAALKAKAKEVLAANEEAIVTVKIVMKNETVMQGRSFGSQDEKNETPGTVINENGLVVVSHFASNPSAMYDEAQFSNGDGGQIQYERKTNITDVRIVLADGKEIPAEFVLRDKDLDLAFLRPKKSGQKFAFVKLATGCKPDLLDETISLLRLGTSVGRSMAVMIGKISAVVKKPRTMYIAGEGTSGFGLPVFNAQGAAIGIGVMKAAPNKDSGHWGGRDMTPVILPSEDVLEAAAQAEKKPADDGEAQPAVEETKMPAAEPKTEKQGEGPPAPKNP